MMKTNGFHGMKALNSEIEVSEHVYGNTQVIMQPNMADDFAGKRAKEAYDKRTKLSGIAYDGMFYPTLPLNSIRMKELAESLDLIHDRKPSYMELVKNTDDPFPLGTSYILKAGELQGMYGWDGANYDFTDTFDGLVEVKVAVVDPSYGIKVLVTQL